jgi:transcriptional antiterminator Rof (Rho-off)
MKRQGYRPIACGLHEQYQLAAMRGALLDISWESETEGSMTTRLRIVDVFTRDSAEYLSGETLAGEQHQIRLDRIRLAHWAESGTSLDGIGKRQ